MSNPTGRNQYSSGGAAMARSFHSGAKKEFSKMGAFNISADTSKAARKGIAQQIKEIRRGSSNFGRPMVRPSEYVVHTAVSNAAASTRLRNLHKMGKLR